MSDAPDLDPLVILEDEGFQKLFSAEFPNPTYWKKFYAQMIVYILTKARTAGFPAGSTTSRGTQEAVTIGHVERVRALEEDLTCAQRLTIQKQRVIREVSVALSVLAEGRTPKEAVSDGTLRCYVQKIHQRIVNDPYRVALRELLHAHDDCVVGKESASLAFSTALAKAKELSP